MNLLLCTHSFVWWTTARKKLLARAFTEISNSANQVFLSVASLWELQIKIQINKFQFTDPLEIVVNEQIKINGFQLLPVTFAHVLELEKLPFHHKDLFDRLLIAQAIAENMILVSSDKIFSAYPVNLLW